MTNTVHPSPGRSTRPRPASEGRPPEADAAVPPGRGRLGAVVLALFFLSGACGLVYEVVWMRMLTLVFGATALAASTILASFFAGLALGAWVLGGVADRSPRPLRIYAWLEAGIGASAFLMPFLLAGVTDLYVGVARQLGLGIHALHGVRFVLGFLVFLVPATLMGGTLPVMVRFLTGRGEGLGWNVGRLYAANTFGAVVGTVSAGFFLILLLGVRETAYAAGLVNLALAAAVLLLDRRLGATSPQETQETQETERERRLEEEPDTAVGGASPRLARLALWAAGISGLCALALEVLWTRSLVYFLDNSTHAFTTMLTAFLLGIALGSALVARFLDRGRKLVAWLGWVQVLIGVSAALAIPILGASAPVLRRMADSAWDGTLWWRWTGLRFLTSLTVMLVPTLLMGIAFPLAAKIYVRGAGRVGQALGRVYAVNTLGGVLGSVAAGFLLIPWMGLQGSIVLVAAVNLGLGVVLLAAEPGTGLRPALAGTAGAAVMVTGLGAFRAPSDTPRLTSYIEELDAAEVLDYREGVGATVKVFRDEEGARYLSIDGFPVAGTSLGLHDAQKALGNLPMLLSDVPGARVALVGFGVGGASWGTLQYDVSRVDCVELVSAVPEMAGWFSEVNHGVLDHPRFNLIPGDGRNHLLVTDETYDVISIDATSPKMAGNGSLYSLEFYRLLEERLSEDGLVVQWLPIHLLSDAEVRMTARTLLEVFPHTTLWLSAIRHHGLLVSGRKPLRIDYGALARKLEREGVRRELEPMRVSDAVDVLGWFVMGEEGLADYVAGAPLNTDNHPYLEFTPAMAYFAAKGYLVTNLVNLNRHRESVRPLLFNAGASEEEAERVAERVDRRFEAMRHTIGGDVLFYLGREERARREYHTALLIDPADKNWANAAWREESPPR